MKIRPEQIDRNKIDLESEIEVKHWSKRFGVSVERLRDVVAKVGNSVEAIRAELARSG